MMMTTLKASKEAISISFFNFIFVFPIFASCFFFFTFLVFFL